MQKRTMNDEVKRLYGEAVMYFKILEFAWMNSGKLQEMSVKIASLQSEI